ncbi:lipase-like domain-containing protein, partial [Staphylococcus capitis]
GDPEQGKYQKKHPAHISPLYKPPQHNILSSITTLPPPHNPTHPPHIPNQPFIPQLPYHYPKFQPTKHSKVDVRLKQSPLPQTDHQA